MAQRAIQANTEKLRKAGLRPTRQRLALASLLFAPNDRHVTAEGLHEEAVAARVPVSRLDVTGATGVTVLHRASTKLEP